MVKEMGDGMRTDSDEGGKEINNHVSAHALMDRHELVRNAVGFLSDPSVRLHLSSVVSVAADTSFLVAKLTPRTKDSIPRSKRSDFR